VNPETSPAVRQPEEHQGPRVLERAPLPGVGEVAVAQWAAVEADQRPGLVGEGVVAGEVEHARYSVEKIEDGREVGLGSPVGHARGKGCADGCHLLKRVGW
jgi:hypothetical protein